MDGNMETPEIAPAPVAGSMTITKDGVRVCAPFALGQILLEAGEAAGLTLPFTCRKGKCGACMVKLTGGTVEMAADSRALSRRDRERGFILMCRAVGTSSEVAVDYDFC